MRTESEFLIGVLWIVTGLWVVPVTFFGIWWVWQVIKEWWIGRG